MKKILLFLILFITSFNIEAKKFTKFIHYNDLNKFVKSELIKLKKNKNYSKTEYTIITSYLKSFLIEQNKYGIPVSISAAQLIEESAVGTSFLAKKAKNLFGRKSFSKKDKRITRADDVKNDKFKVYPTQWHSIRDRSKFLTTNERYELLFNIQFPSKKPFLKYNTKEYCFKGKTDKNFNKKLKILEKNWDNKSIRWAYGLDVVGYATDNNYAKNMLKHIKKYKLNRFDHIRLLGV